MEKKQNDKKENCVERCRECEILFDPEDEFMETEKMTPQEKKDYMEFLWRRRFFSC